MNWNEKEWRPTWCGVAIAIQRVGVAVGLAGFDAQRQRRRGRGGVDEAAVSVASLGRRLDVGRRHAVARVEEQARRQRHQTFGRVVDVVVGRRQVVNGRCRRRHRRHRRCGAGRPWHVVCSGLTRTHLGRWILENVVHQWVHSFLISWSDFVGRNTFDKCHYHVTVKKLQKSIWNIYCISDSITWNWLFSAFGVIFWMKITNKLIEFLC